MKIKIYILLIFIFSLINYVEATSVCVSGCDYSELYDCLDFISGQGYSCDIKESNVTYNLGNGILNVYSLSGLVSIEASTNSKNIVINCDNKTILHNNTGYEVFRQLPINLIMLNCEFKQAQGAPMFKELTNNKLFYNNTFYGSDKTTIDTTGALNITFLKNTFVYSSILSAGGDDRIINNTFLYSNISYALYVEKGTDDSEFIIKGNIFINSTKDALVINDDNIEIRNNIFVGSVGSGIKVNPLSINFTIANNTFKSNGNVTFDKALSVSKQNVNFGNDVYDHEFVIFDYYYLLNVPIPIMRNIMYNNTGLTNNDSYNDDYSFVLWKDTSNVFLQKYEHNFQILVNVEAIEKVNINNCTDFKNYILNQSNNICTISGGIPYLCGHTGGNCTLFEKHALLYNSTFGNYSWNTTSVDLSSIVVDSVKLYNNNNWVQGLEDADIRVTLFNGVGKIYNNFFDEINHSSNRIGIKMSDLLVFNISVYNNHLRKSHIEALDSNNFCKNDTNEKIGNFYSDITNEENYHFIELGDCGTAEFLNKNGTSINILNNLLNLTWKMQNSLFDINYGIFYSNDTLNYTYYGSTFNLSYEFDLRNINLNNNHIFKIIPNDGMFNSTSAFLTLITNNIYCSYDDKPYIGNILKDKFFWYCLIINSTYNYSCHSYIENGGLIIQNNPKQIDIRSRGIFLETFKSYYSLLNVYFTNENVYAGGNYEAFVKCVGSNEILVFNATIFPTLQNFDIVALRMVYVKNNIDYVFIIIILLILIYIAVRLIRR